VRARAVRPASAAVVAVLRFALRIYRLTLSPLLGPSCRFHPSCSHYAEEALCEWGVVRGTGLTVWRLLRCHPFAAGGHDPVPPAPSRFKTHSSPVGILRGKDLGGTAGR
jgi:uncharacterized protein